MSTTKARLSLADRSTKVSDEQCRRFKRIRLHKQYLHNYMAEIDACVRQTDYLKEEKIVNSFTPASASAASPASAEPPTKGRIVSAGAKPYVNKNNKNKKSHKENIVYPHVSFDLSNPPPSYLAVLRAKQQQNLEIRNKKKTLRHSSDSENNINNADIEQKALEEEIHGSDSRSNAYSKSVNSSSISLQERRQEFNNRIEKDDLDQSSDSEDAVSKETKVKLSTSSESNSSAKENRNNKKKTAKINKSSSDAKSNSDKSDSKKRKEEIKNAIFSENDSSTSSNSAKNNQRFKKLGILKHHNNSNNFSSSGSSNKFVDCIAVSDYSNNDKDSRTNNSNNCQQQKNSEEEGGYSSGDNDNPSAKRKSRTSYFMKGNVQMSSSSDENDIEEEEEAVEEEVEEEVEEAVKEEAVEAVEEEIEEENGSTQILTSSANGKTPNHNASKDEAIDEFPISQSSPSRVHVEKRFKKHDSDDFNYSYSSQKIDNNARSSKVKPPEFYSSSNSSSEVEQKYLALDNSEINSSSKMPSRIMPENQRSCLSSSSTANSSNVIKENEVGMMKNEFDDLNDSDEKAAKPKKDKNRDDGAASDTVVVAQRDVSLSNSDSDKKCNFSGKIDDSEENENSTRNGFVSFSSSSKEKSKSFGSSSDRRGMKKITADKNEENNNNDDDDIKGKDKNGDSFWAIEKKPTAMFSNYDGTSNASFDFKPVQPMSSSESDDILPKLKNSYRLILDSSSDEDRRSSGVGGRVKNPLNGAKGVFSGSSDSDEAY